MPSIATNPFSTMYLDRDCGASMVKTEEFRFFVIDFIKINFFH